MTVKPRTESPLADRIADALRNETPSDAIAALIEEAEWARSETEKAHGKARNRALDPEAGSKAASAAKRKAEDLRFEIERLDSALIALRAAQDEAKEREGDRAPACRV
jgi:hypothetical protein